MRGHSVDGQVVHRSAHFDPRSTPLNLFRLLPRLAAASFAFALSAHSYAYCLTYTCDANKEDCPIDSQTGCNIGGKALYWASSIVSFDVQQDGSKLQNISYDQLHEVVVNAFQRWTNAPCDDSHGPSIKLADYGPVACAKPEYNKSQPNQNVITFHDTKWPYKNTGAETLALTTVFFSPDTGEIYDANIEINSYQAEGEPPRFVLGAGEADAEHDDLNAVLTHEVGHFLGLSHSIVRDATMFASYEVGMTTLEDDDIAAICASLPPDRTTTDPGTPPVCRATASPLSVANPKMAVARRPSAAARRRAGHSRCGPSGSAWSPGADVDADGLRVRRDRSARRGRFCAEARRTNQLHVRVRVRVGRGQEVCLRRRAVRTRVQAEQLGLARQIAATGAQPHFGARHGDARGRYHAHQIQRINRGQSRKRRAFDPDQGVYRHALGVWLELREFEQHAAAVVDALAHRR